MHDPVELSAIDRGAGPPVILVHGGVFHSGPAWAKSIQPLAEAGYRAIAVDRRGHGRSEPGSAERVSVHLHADDLRYTLELRQARQAHVVGVSYGALVCLEYALSWPDRALSLTLLEPPLFTWLAGHRDFGIWFDRFIDIAREARAGRALEEWVPEWLSLMDAEMSKELAPGSRAWTMVEKHGHLILKEEAGWEYEPRSEGLDTLDIPAMVINGELSEPPMQEIGEMLAERLPDARYEIIKRAGHDAHAKVPEAFNNLLLSFLGSEGPHP